MTTAPQTTKNAAGLQENRSSNSTKTVAPTKEGLLVLQVMLMPCFYADMMLSDGGCCYEAAHAEQHKTCRRRIRTHSH